MLLAGAHPGSSLGAVVGSRELIREWIQDVFTRGESTDLIQFNATVELAEYDRESAEWSLTLRKEHSGKKTDYWWQEKFDSLVVASGHFYLPYVPDIPGLLEFDEKSPGRIQHSKHYRSVEDYRDKVRKSNWKFWSASADRTWPESCCGRGFDISL